MNGKRSIIFNGRRRRPECTVPERVRSTLYTNGSVVQRVHMRCRETEKNKVETKKNIVEQQCGCTAIHINISDRCLICIQYPPGRFSMWWRRRRLQRKLALNTSDTLKIIIITIIMMMKYKIHMHKLHIGTTTTKSNREWENKIIWNKSLMFVTVASGCFWCRDWIWRSRMWLSPICANAHMYTLEPPLPPTPANAFYWNSKCCNFFLALFYSLLPHWNQKIACCYRVEPKNYEKA